MSVISRDELATSANAAVREFHRLYLEAPDVIEEVVAFLRQRHHTATVTLRIHGGRLQCADLLKVSRAAPPNEGSM